MSLENGSKHTIMQIIQKQIQGQLAWYVARTRNGQEISVRNRLASLGIDYFIPTEQVTNYRGREKEHPIINCLVFIRSTKASACELKTNHGLPIKYVTDSARHTMLTIPEKQMDDFIRVLTEELYHVDYYDDTITYGERVKISKGPLKGVEGNVIEQNGNTYVVVSLNGMAYTKAKVPNSWIKKIH